MKELRSRRTGSPALSRSLEGYKLDETKQRNDSGTDECWRTPRDWSGGTCEWNSAGAGRVYYLDVQERMKVRIIPGTQLFQWMLRHSVWTVVGYQSDQRTKQTPHERTRGCRYESALVPFGEVVMAKIADADKMRAGKLDSAWVKTVWVGRVDKSNEHLLLTTKGLTHSRRQPSELPC